MTYVWMTYKHFGPWTIFFQLKNYLNKISNQKQTKYSKIKNKSEGGDKRRNTLFLLLGCVFVATTPVSKSLLVNTCGLWSWFSTHNTHVQVFVSVYVGWDCFNCIIFNCYYGHICLVASNYHVFCIAATI